MSNIGMGVSSRLNQSTALKIIALTVALGVCAGIAVMLPVRWPGPKITDQYLLREAATEWRRSGNSGNGPSYQIFEQQAAQGYYEDATATASLFKPADDRQSYIVELAKIRAENGDIQGAKKMIQRFAGSDVGTRAAGAIAVVQALNGDLQGALDTSVSSATANEVRGIFSYRQIQNGNFAGALATAERMDQASADQVFYEIGDVLRERGEAKRIPALASKMSDRKLAALFVELARFTPGPSEVRTIRATPCDMVYFNASNGKFAEALALMEQNKCRFDSFVAVARYSVDPAGAENLLRTRADRQELVRGLNEFALAAAKKGDVGEALRFLDDVKKLNANLSAWAAVHEIARVWTVRDGAKRVLPWARSRSDSEERVWALIGMAEALGHARPQSQTSP